MFSSHNRRIRKLLPGFLIGILPLTGRALDAGYPFFKNDVDEPLTLEVVFERLDRNIVQEVAFSGSRFAGDQEEDRLAGRLYYYATPRVTLHLQLGSTDAEQSSSNAPLAGGGLSVRIWERGALRLSGFASGTYVHEIEYRRPGVLTPLAEIAAVRRLESYAEYGGGARLSADVFTRPGIRLAAYGGVTFSVMEAEGEEHFTFTTTGQSQSDHSVDFDEDGAGSLFAGLVLQRNANFGARLEGRFVDQSSYTAGIFFSF
jgi:hypothetical protein